MTTRKMGARARTVQECRANILRASSFANKMQNEPYGTFLDMA